MSFQKRLKQLRLEKKMTQKDVADQLGITRQAYGYYENEKSNREPDHASTQKLAEIFGVTIDYLLSGNQKENGDEDFQKFINDPSLERWYRELPKSSEEDLRKLRKMWEIIKSEKE